MLCPSLGNDLYVLAELLCPACKEYMEPPIIFCESGHNICRNCRINASSCPTCKQAFLKFRNFSLERLSQKMKFRCNNRHYGCKEAFPYRALREHKANCSYIPQRCPVDYLMLTRICTWTGIANDIKQHLQTAHADLCEDYNGNGDWLYLPCPTAPGFTCKFLFVYNEIFCYRLENRRGKISVILHYIGPAENDMKYQYKIFLRNEEETEGVKSTLLARSFTEPEDDLFFPKNCLRLHRAFTDRFRDEDGDLLLWLQILSVDE
jgi:hypothetical protein